jgi:hypothetical protein
VTHFRTNTLILCPLFAILPALQAQQQPSTPQAPPPPPPGQQAPQPPPPAPKAPDVLLQDEGQISLDGFAWLPTGHPSFNKGQATTSTEASNATFQGQPKFAWGVNVRIPQGGHNAFRLSYFDTQASGSFTAPTDLNLWGSGYNAGDSISTTYRLRSFGFSYDFLTWPYPVRERRFRFKTLWQFQYASVKSTFDAPLSTNPPAPGMGSKSIYLPGLGIGITEYLSKNARVEALVSGFDIPSHAALANGEADIAYKFGRIELRAGGKFFYFKTSPQADFYMKGTLAGAFAGLRFYWY